MAEPIKVLQVYGQGAWHDDVYIVGNREALEALRDAINTAIDTGQGETACFVSDGEGFTTAILRDDTVFGNPEWYKYPVPYSDNIAKEKREEVWVPFMKKMR
jgi:hypothetical protein